MAIAGKSPAETLVVTPEGRIDTTTAPSLQTEFLELIRKGERNLILDLGRVRYVSSAGLRVLLVTSKALDKHRGRLVLCAVAREVQHVFDVSGFSELLTIAGTRTEAHTLLGLPVDS